MTTPAPITVTSTLQSIWNDAGEPIAIAALAVSGPFGAAIAGVFNVPIIGSILKYFLNNFVDGLIAAGVIEVKIGIIKFLSSDARAKWAPQVALLEQYAAENKTLTPEQQAAYDAALQNLVKSHPGVVGA